MARKTVRVLVGGRKQRCYRSNVTSLPQQLIDMLDFRRGANCRITLDHKEKWTGSSNLQTFGSLV